MPFDSQKDITREEQISSSLARIMDFPGMDDIKQTVRRWEILRKNIGRIPPEAPVLLPEYLWVSKSGTGKTEMLHLIADYLDAAQLMPFNGLVKVIEYTMDYCDPDLHFGQLEDLIDALSASSGYHNEFKGILALNIDAWLEHLEEKHFVELLEFISDHNRSLLLILIVWPDDRYLDQLESMLSVYLRISRIVIELPSAEVMIAFIEDRLSAYKCRMADETRSMLLDTISAVRDLDGFDGYKTLEFMAQDIVYNYYCSENAVSGLIGPEHISKYLDTASISHIFKERYDKKRDMRIMAGFHPGSRG